MDDTVIGSMDYKGQGRALCADENHGLLRLYAEKSTGKLVGAEMAVPDGEHLAHSISWAIQRGSGRRVRAMNDLQDIRSLLRRQELHCDQ